MNGMVKFVAMATVGLVCVSTAPAAEMEWVTVSNTGNPMDTRHPYAGVREADTCYFHWMSSDIGDG